MKKQVVFVKTNTEKPKNCEINVLDVDAFYKISLNENFLNIIPYLTTFILALQRLLPNFQLAFSSYSNIKTYSYVTRDILINFNQLDENKENFLSDKLIANFQFNKSNKAGKKL